MGGERDKERRRQRIREAVQGRQSWDERAERREREKQQREEERRKETVKRGVEKRKRG